MSRATAVVALSLNGDTLTITNISAKRLQIEQVSLDVDKSMSIEYIRSGLLSLVRFALFEPSCGRSVGVSTPSLLIFAKPRYKIYRPFAVAPRHQIDMRSSR